MTDKDIITKFCTDFLEPERNSLLKGSAISEMTKGDRVKVDVEMLDYLRDFQKAIYHGEPIPKVFDKALIELSNIKSGDVLRFYVTFAERQWVFIEVYANWFYIGKLLFHNIQLSEEDKIDGRYQRCTPMIATSTAAGNKIPLDLRAWFVEKAIDVFTYSYLYIWANKENPSIFKEEEIPTGTNNKKKRSYKKHTKPKAKTRDTVHVPTRRIYTVKPVEIPKKHMDTITLKNERTCHYQVAEWGVKGFTRKHTRKDGTVVEITVKPHQRHRMKKLEEGAIPKKDSGKDYILRERPLKKDSSSNSE